MVIKKLEYVQLYSWTTVWVDQNTHNLLQIHLQKKSWMWRNSTKLLFQTVISVHTFNQPVLLWMLQTINPVTLELHCVYDQIWLFCLVSKGQSCIINKAVKEKLYLKKTPKPKPNKPQSTPEAFYSTIHNYFQ